MRTTTALALASLLAAGCAHAPPEPDLVDLERVAPGVSLSMRYAGPDNFVGEPIDGYEGPRCLLTPAAARALAGAQRELEARGLGLRVFDCYRPQRAVDHFVRWAEDLSDQRTKARHYPSVDKSRLFAEGYIAARSSHSRGSTVDATLVARDGDRLVELDMGGPFDLFDPRSHGDSPAIGAAERRNRRLLRDVLDRAGFERLPEEWWHYTLRDEPYPDDYFDRVIR